MGAISVVGAQWGDEGKGRIVDYLATKADAVIRYQGGDNAGHTVINEYGKFGLHIIPSGIFNRNAISIVGAGCVVNFERMEDELKNIPNELHSNLYIDRRAHLIFPFNKDLDGAEENKRSQGDKVGTTKCGIGPTYADKASRIGLRAGDLLLRSNVLDDKICNLLSKKNLELSNYGLNTYSFDEIKTLTDKWTRLFGDKIIDTLPILEKLIKENKTVLLEGQLGVMRDIDWGIYPYCTSSSTTSGGAAALSGIPFTEIKEVVGIVKAYTSSVGGGPFPTELFDETGDKLRSVGAEFGVTTGRPRRCGWLDAVALKTSAYLNAFTTIAITKLDILDTFQTIKIATSYRLDGKVIDYLPDAEDQKRVEPIYEELEGWMTPTTECRTWDSLPTNAKKYITRMEELIGVKAKYISVGPERDQLIIK